MGDVCILIKPNQLEPSCENQRTESSCQVRMLQKTEKNKRDPTVGKKMQDDDTTHVACNCMTVVQHYLRGVPFDPLNFGPLGCFPRHRKYEENCKFNNVCGQDPPPRIRIDEPARSSPCSTSPVKHKSNYTI